MQTNDLADENFKKLKELFPNAVTETITGHDEKGKPIIERAVDADVLRQEINYYVVEGPDERYQFTWPDKRKAQRLAAAPIAASLRPCREESVNFDATGNVYVEGDNLDVLKLLRETYLGKVKMIFIDPPYNTGNDFIYEDDFSGDRDEFLLNDNQYDEQGNRLVQNTDSNGRFHTDWLNMLYPRLRVAKDLLSEDGVIFISIDDNEVSNLRKVCDEVFGATNFITDFVWEKKKKPSFLHRNVGKLFDYIVCYAKSSEKTVPFSVETTTLGKKYPFNNAGNGKTVLTFPPQSVMFKCQDGVIQPQDMSEGNIFTELLSPVIIRNGKNENEFKLLGEWRYSQERLNQIVKNGEQIVISKIPFRPNHIKAGGELKKMKNFLTISHYSMETNEDATEQLIRLMGTDCFDNPKPVGLLQCLIKGCLYNAPEAIILDFFSGSATTAHATMQLNAEDAGNRKFIMVQLPEPCAEDSEAFKAGYKNICDIGKERIRRAGKKIKDEKPLTTKNLDVGFRVFKLDSSNMKDVYYSPSETPQKDLLGRVDNIKEGRTPEDLLFQVMLEFGIPLSSKIKESLIAGKKVFNVEDNYLIACFDDAITEEAITAIAKEKPQYVVLRDSGFKTDSVAANFEQIFATYSPDTTRRVL